MAPLPSLPLAAGLDDVAQLLIFVVLAIGAAIQHALKKRAEEKKRAESAERWQQRRSDAEHEEHAGPRTHRPPPPAPPGTRTPAATVGFVPAPSPPPPAAPTRPARPLVVAESTRRARALSGRALLFAKSPSRRDRIRAGLLWNEVLGPPRALGS